MFFNVSHSEIVGNEIIFLIQLYLQQTIIPKDNSLLINTLFIAHNSYTKSKLTLSVSENSINLEIRLL
jgi:hypothetical protein